MINWESIIYDIYKAKKDFENLKVNVLSVEPIQPRDELIAVRKVLLEKRDEVFDKYEFDKVNKLDYSFDLTFGLELYEVLNETIGFNNRVATNDDVWRYLSICVIPDIVHSRWSLNEDHFYKVPRRIWLKTIWWYVHLSWRNTKEETYEILKNNTTDTILQLVERPSIGYYVEMYRELMYQYKQYEDTSRNLFRRALKLNTAQLLTISPELVEGGITQYVSDLFETAKNQ